MRTWGISLLAALLFVSIGSTVKASADKGEYLVGFETGVGENRQTDIASRIGSVEHEFQYMNVLEMNIPSKAVQALENNPNVAFVEKNKDVEISAEYIPWGVDYVEAPSIQETGITGQGADVAVLDTGISDNHFDLTVTGGESFISYEPSPFEDGNGHGTHVAGTIAALDNGSGLIGVANNTQLHAVKVLDSSGSGSLSTIIKGIEWSISNDMDIVNMSLGTASGAESLEMASDNAEEEGIFMVGAAGNSGTDGANNTIGYPARYDSVMAIGSIDRYEDRSSFSSVGEELEVMAPGSSITSTYPGQNYATLSGTSMAAPHVSGAAALMLDQNPSLSNEEIRLQLNNTADPAGDSFYYGNGIIDLPEAIESE
ncbi:S8 family peptidase [Marinococcus halotolerans]|uniref:S8 family peptidase n=1 Tax=Marinococcus halotolerans TaxID=301092 RepID=UPI0003B761F6|nr:S8 family peptidase [Marinococcus halotolerans]